MVSSAPLSDSLRLRPQISPQSGPLEGGTLLTVQGKNLGRRADEVNVSIGSFPCALLADRYTVSTQ